VIIVTSLRLLMPLYRMDKDAYLCAWSDAAYVHLGQEGGQAAPTHANSVAPLVREPLHPTMTEAEMISNTALHKEALRCNNALGVSAGERDGYD
jgi:hypothetical protein